MKTKSPNHSTFSKNRHGRFHDSSLFRWLFNDVLRRGMDAGLVKGEGFAVDASALRFSDTLMISSFVMPQ
ncbi:hypothetical protein PSCICO_42540 [Pseudomonas cichorii]|nr:hypothetical protein PSCICO_42540 [Pseudomonas cichorii]